MYQGATSQLILQSGERISEAKNGLATLIRTYNCAESYAATARSILVPGYVPSGYPYIRLFTVPEETILNGICTFNCTFYGVLDPSRYNQPYDYFESRLLTGSIQYNDPYAPNATTYPINGQSVTKSFNYFGPAIIRSYVLQSSDPVQFNAPAFSDFNGYPISTYNNVTNVTPYRDLDAERVLVATHGVITPTRSTVTSYGVVQVIESVFQLSLPDIGKYYVSLGSGTAAGCTIYTDPSKHYTAPTISGLTVSHLSLSDYTTHYTSLTSGSAAPPAVPTISKNVALSWNNSETVSDQFPQTIFSIISSFDTITTTDAGGFQNRITKTLDHANVIIGSNYGVYQVSVNPSESSSLNPPLTSSVVQMGPASIVRNIKYNADGHLSFVIPEWDGISDVTTYHNSVILGYSISGYYYPNSYFVNDGYTYSTSSITGTPNALESSIVIKAVTILGTGY